MHTFVCEPISIVKHVYADPKKAKGRESVTCAEPTNARTINMIRHTRPVLIRIVCGDPEFTSCDVCVSRRSFISYHATFRLQHLQRFRQWKPFSSRSEKRQD